MKAVFWEGKFLCTIEKDDWGLAFDLEKQGFKIVPCEVIDESRKVILKKSEGEG